MCGDLGRRGGVDVGDRCDRREPDDRPREGVASSESLNVRVGDVAIRIEASKMWTLSGIEYRRNTMAVEESAYGTILTIRDVGTLGSAHFLDVPEGPVSSKKRSSRICGSISTTSH